MTQTEPFTSGRNTGGKPINLGQLEQELVDSGAQPRGLGMTEEFVYTYDESGAAVDFENIAAADQAIAAHVAMRNKTTEEYAAEFQNPATETVRKQEIRDIQNGLLPAEQVPITQAEWDQMHGVGVGAQA